MTLKAKFRCYFIQKADDDSSRTIHMSAVTSGSHENEAWSKLTPCGHVQMHISNPEAFNQFKQNKEYYVVIDPVVEEVSVGQSVWQLPKNRGIPV